MSITQRLDTDRKLLLQLSGSNPAINYKEFRAKGLRSSHQDIPAMLQLLLNDRVLRFEAGNIPEEAPASTQPPDTLRFSGEEETLQQRLQKTADEARLAEEEQGVNILFLAFGALEWMEEGRPDKRWRSPLLLVPVKLSKTLSAGRTRWSLRYSGEDIEPNHSLIEALRQYHRMELPPMPDFEAAESSLALSTDWNTWLNELQNRISGKPGWALDRALVLLSFFSFAKYLMYQDLDPEKWSEAIAAGQLPVISGLLEDGFTNDTEPIPEDFNFDLKLPADQPLSVLDMDSSQAAVLLEARQSPALIVQGPPGTGKSQTITNLIASAVSEGKKVLFVAEKMAALDVVKRNLTKVGLGPAVLELHGAKARKTAFLEDLRDVLGNPRQASLPGTFSTASLNTGRDKLRSWSTLISTPLQACGYKPYELFGLLIWAGEQLPGIPVPPVHRLCDSELQFREHVARLGKDAVGNHVVNGPATQELLRFQEYRHTVGAPERHPFFGTRLNQPMLGSAQEELRQRLEELIAALDTLDGLFLPLIKAFPGLPQSLAGLGTLLRNYAALLHVPDPEMLPLTGAADWSRDAASLRQLLDLTAEAREIRNQYRGLLLEAAWDADVLQSRGVLATTSDNFFTRLFNGRLRAARRQIRGLLQDPAAARSQSLQEIADIILGYQAKAGEIRALEPLAKAFGTLWQGLSSDVERLRGLVDWASAVHGDLKAKRLSPGLPQWLLGADPQTVQVDASALETARQHLTKAMDAVATMLDLEDSLRAGWQGAPLPEVRGAAASMHANLQRLPEWIRYYAAAVEFRTTDRSWIVQVAERWEHAGSHLVPYFRLKVWEAMLEAAMQRHPELHQQTREQLDALRRNFSSEDDVLKTYFKAELINQHAAAIAGFGNIGQAAIVRSNLHRKRNIPPIRKLLAEAFTAIAAVKPVFMMSPLSVAGYLQATPGLFDLVVFDEASQVEPVDAYGAMLRAKQVVVVGDTKQMPPTGFFKRVLSEEAAPEDESRTTDELVRDTDSIMELMLARNARARSLRWHYRSRHESLIAVSNRNFYTPPGLLVYPSAFSDHEFLGLKLRRLDPAAAPYEGEGTNTGEARALVRELRDFIYANPDRSVGVVAFNIRQRDAIQKEIQIRSRQDSVLARFVGKEGIEPFFVKNLENVQGDERDVIFISTGYGKTADGKFAYSFGALNKSGGERRLNVLITRARLQCRVFCNFSSDDIDVGRVKHLGVRVLKEFLFYAEHGRELHQEPVERVAESLFEEQVLAAIREMGYDAALHVGSRGYRIDLAVKHPQQAGRYVLAVECDGATYHGAASSRDRDRLRQSVLEGLGWQFYRVWSANWFYNREQESARLRAAIEAAVIHADTPVEPVGNASPATAPEDELIVEAAAPLSETPGFKAYEDVDTTGWSRASSIAEMQPALLERYMLKLIQAESPVHQERIFERIVEFQETRLGAKIRRQLEAQLEAILRAGQAERNGAFIWKPGQAGTIGAPRSYAAIEDRDLGRIAPQELDAAIITLLRQAFTASVEELLDSAARSLGFARVTAGMRETLMAHLQSMTERGLVSETDGRVRPSEV